MDNADPHKFSLSPDLTSSSPVIHSLLQSNVHFLMETFSPGDVTEELREFEERCRVFFFLFQGFVFGVFLISKKKTETKDLE